MQVSPWMKNMLQRTGLIFNLSYFHLVPQFVISPYLFLLRNTPHHLPLECNINKSNLIYCSFKGINILGFILNRWKLTPNSYICWQVDVGSKSNKCQAVKNICFYISCSLLQSTYKCLNIEIGVEVGNHRDQKQNWIQQIPSQHSSTLKWKSRSLQNSLKLWHFSSCLKVYQNSCLSLTITRIWFLFASKRQQPASTQEVRECKSNVHWSCCIAAPTSVQWPVCPDGGKLSKNAPCKRGKHSLSHSSSIYSYPDH